MAAHQNNKWLYIFLHGYESCGHDLDGIQKRFAIACAGSFVCPDAPYRVPKTTPAAFSWFESDERGVNAQSLHSSANVIDIVMREFRRSPQYSDHSVALGGFSQGAAMALYMASIAQQPFDALVLHSPFVPEGMDVDVDLHNIAATRVFLSAQTHDDVVPYDFSLAIADLLSPQVPVTTVEAPGGHTLSHELTDNAFDWLSS